jgi:hypothetical protein
MNNNSIKPYPRLINARKIKHSCTYIKVGNQKNGIEFVRELSGYHIFSNISFGAPHTGQTQSSGRSSKAVPGFALGKSPTSGSYI